MKQLRHPRSRTGSQHSARPVNLQPDTYRRSQTPGQRSGIAPSRGRIPPIPLRGRPPPYSNSSGSRNTTPQLSVKEKAELISAGKCFECKETGHLARNCPTKTTVKSNGSRPPGASTFNIE
ncbi:hypothetical protein BYT27DRAFT_7106071, partial [Phlegmacium glaucopus]